MIYHTQHNHLKEKKTESKQDLITINEQKLNPIWNNLCEKLKSEGKMNLHATLRNQKYKKIDKSILKIHVKSETQKKEIIDNQHMILEFLKKKIDAKFIKIDVNIELFKEEKVLYTNEDKLKYIIQENPKVLELIKNLDLEIKE